ncbi:MAG TPA: DUF2877 domain-containing protein [Miltoncostaeaceae bacterium]|jgi:hypothetical protein|nr:DUF2877 domain-containing protein [Miltoncostaeaceae bacterium]
MRSARIVVRTGTVAFAEAGGELLALHGPAVEAFPFSLVVARVPPEDDLLVGDGVVVAGGRRLAARAVPAAVPVPPGVDAAVMLRALDGVPGLAARREALGDPDDPERLLGRGPGLTPSGDDLLLGRLAMAAHAHRHWGVPDPAPLAAYLAERAPGRTTRVAAAMYAAAARGRYAPAIGAACAAAPGDLPAALARLAAVGATSGLDTLAGIAATAAGVSPGREPGPA